MSALEPGIRRPVTLESLDERMQMMLRCMEEIKRDQRHRWEEQHQANARLHQRLDEIARGTSESIKELAIAQADSVTRQDCDDCKRQRHAVSPKVALAITVTSGLIGAGIGKIPWGQVFQILKGG